jgi:hypothetical protein
MSVLNAVRVPRPPAAGGPASSASPSTSAPLLPHERDEGATPSTDAPTRSGGGGDARIGQAARDLTNGQVDTDLRATPGLDAARRRALVGSGRPHSGGASKPAPGPTVVSTSDSKRSSMSQKAEPQPPIDGDPTLQGEGTYSAARRHRSDATRHAHSGKVDAAARRAAPRDAEEAAEMAAAEREGKRHAKK